MYACVINQPPVSNNHLTTPSRRRAWLEQRFGDKIDGGGSNSNRRKGPPPRAPVDPLDVCLDVMAGFAQAGEAGAEEALVQRALAEVREQRAGSVKAIRDPVLKALAPKCPHHRQPARLLKVKKAGPNKSRRFYTCSFPRGCVALSWRRPSDPPKGVFCRVDFTPRQSRNPAHF